MAFESPSDDIDRAAAQLAHTLGRHGRLTVLTGAGVSAESGVPTFRDMGGLWQQYDWRELATPESFANKPELVLEFYNTRRRQLPQVRPNPAHQALAQLERALGERLTLITQNVDDLHERAGSQRVLHMHGQLSEKRCPRCGRVSPYDADIVVSAACEQCGGGPLRPNVVWFGEIPHHLDGDIPDALQAEAFMSIGTSGTVYPAAGFVNTAKSQGRFTLEVNLEPSDNALAFDVQLLGPAGAVLPTLVSKLTDALDG